MVIPAGSKTLNPSDVLSSERMKMLVAHLKENFDYVVMDSPPVGPVMDSIIIGNLADKSIFVVQWASTPRDLVETCVKKMSAHRRVGGHRPKSRETKAVPRNMGANTITGIVITQNITLDNPKVTTPVSDRAAQLTWLPGEYRDLAARNDLPLANSVSTEVCFYLIITLCGLGLAAGGAGPSQL